MLKIIKYIKMDQIIDLVNKLASLINSKILLEIINELQQIKNNSHENLIIQRIGDIITKMNSLINENNKQYQTIRNHFDKIEKKLSHINNKIYINQPNEQKELKLDIGKYVGQVVNGKREGKGIDYYNNGDRYEGDFKNDIKEGKGIYYYSNGNRYEGDWKNGKSEGKGIYYYNNGDRYEGDYKNDKKEGKGIFYYNNGDRYEGDWKNGKRHGKGIYYYNNGNREMGDFYNGFPKGKFVMLKNDGEIKVNNY